MPHARPRSYDVCAGWGSHPPEHAYDDAAGVAVDATGRVHVLTRRPAQVLVYDDDGAFQDAWGRGVFTDRVHGITIADSGTIYVVDDGAHCVLSFTADGTSLGTIGPSGVPSDTGYDGSHGSVVRPGGPYHRPTNLAVAPDGTLFVADGYGNCEVHAFSPAGERRFSWGRPGSGEGEFRVVHDLVVLPDERVLVADRENDRIQVFDPSGRFLAVWTDVQRPTAVVHDASREQLIVSELGWRSGQHSFTHGPRPDLPSRVSLLDLDGKVVERWGAEGDPCAPGNFVAAHDAAVDAAGSVYIAEVAWTIGVSQGLVAAGCHTIQKFLSRE